MLADLHQENADAAAEEFGNAGFDVSTATVDISSRQSIHAVVETATKFGDVTGLIQAAGVSPSQASPETILAVDLYGTAVVLEEFGKIITSGVMMMPGLIVLIRAPRLLHRTASAITRSAFITGSDFLIDGGVTASYFYGELAPE